jgi:IS5 family transposase
MHVNTDEDGFVKKMTYTPSNVHDSKDGGINNVD